MLQAELTGLLRMSVLMDVLETHKTFYLYSPLLVVRLSFHNPTQLLRVMYVAQGICLKIECET